MFKLFNASKKQFVALDVGTQNTKMAVLSKKTKDIENIFIEKTPPGLFDAGMILNKEQMTQFIDECLQNIDIQDEISLITGASGKGVITKKIDLPYSDPEKIREHIPFEAEQYLPYDMDDLELDYVTLKNAPVESGSTSVLLAAILKNLLSSYQEVFDNSLMTCEILDVNAFALYNIFERSYNIDPDMNYLLLDIGYKGSNIVMVVNGEVVFTRYIAAGGDFYTQKIKDSMSMSDEEAEELKKSLSMGGEAPEELSSLIQDTIHPAFCDDIYSGYEFYLSFFPENPVSQIYVTGGGSQTPGITDALSQKFEANVEILNPFMNLNLSDQAMDTQDSLQNFSAVVCGLLLRGMK